MPICKFWQAGNCRFGAACRYEHPGETSGFNGGQQPSGNRRRSPDNHHQNPPRRRSPDNRTSHQTGGLRLGNHAVQPTNSFQHRNGSPANVPSQSARAGSHQRSAGFSLPQKPAPSSFLSSSMQNPSYPGHQPSDQTQPQSRPPSHTADNMEWALRSGRTIPDKKRHYDIDEAKIASDFKLERPIWLLSAYAPSPRSPAQMMGGPRREQSFEEVRMAHYMARHQGGAFGEQELRIRAEYDRSVKDAEGQIIGIMQDTRGAVTALLRREKVFPCRLDVLRVSDRGEAWGSRPPLPEYDANQETLSEPPPVAAQVQVNGMQGRAINGQSAPHPQTPNDMVMSVEPSSFPTALPQQQQQAQQQQQPSLFGAPAQNQNQSQPFPAFPPNTLTTSNAFHPPPAQNPSFGFAPQQQQQQQQPPTQPQQPPPTSLPQQGQGQGQDPTAAQPAAEFYSEADRRVWEIVAQTGQFPMGDAAGGGGGGGAGGRIVPEMRPRVDWVEYDVL